ncbi:uncharacterized protein LOC105439758 [Strongylocentrotus purpuratus]|uniref:Uncharacterized protein n=1 Tax=Strongylocentrotus purpuratus TaxID=7668 RepID=A0A7M7P6V5_STRPU|nr:uncharacterized protein LOC105439758 [Strongylocentrotus purpuratus]XP_030846298.1 uncharacterized protein LOC105439758 [Strongylocentrotus purpuratus]
MANLPQDERNDLQREERRLHVAKARRYYSLTPMEQKKCNALVKDYLHPSGIGSEVFLRNLICFFNFETRDPPPRRYEQESALLVIEVCTIMKDLFQPFWNNSQNSDQFDILQKELPDLLIAGGKGYRTVPEFQRELHSILFYILQIELLGLRIAGGEGFMTGPEFQRELQSILEALIDLLEAGRR